eukprot:CAMPEP_0114118492 /NCGR_PEP_ID=MMETSP0043_2-20121206/5610_1 /TAXON_ID=464988 /ORGANISM="Hemiselmis andersenii, Strain CCMP644" /LENGTH=76 /DNA_ID=CAMNT_0001210983 /DNA_START=25 /DNA_END=251 /DNA_ORIENTATION=-
MTFVGKVGTRIVFALELPASRSMARFFIALVHSAAGMRKPACVAGDQYSSHLLPLFLPDFCICASSAIQQIRALPR